MLALCAGGLTAPAMAETRPGTARVVIAQPVTIVKTADLRFGNIIPNGTGAGRVTISAQTGNRTGNANVTLIGPAASGRALFTVTGQANRVVTLRVPAASFTLTGPGPAMTVNTLRVSLNNGGQQTLPRNYTIPATGTMQIGFGGRLNVANNQARGLYSGTFSLIVTYQ